MSEFLDMLATPNLSFFESTYEDARKRFREEAIAFSRGWPGAEMRAFAVPNRQDADLTVDSLFLPATREKKNLVVMVSGVHGVEAYTGSAIQRMFLAEFGPKLERERTSYLITHVMNPFGCKYIRRVTENNIDMNRNFPAGPGHYQRANDGYELLRPTVEIEGRVETTSGTFLQTAWRALSRLALGHYSVQGFTQAFAQGQFHSPQGLSWGGSGPEPQVTDFLADLKKRSDGHENVLLFDLHTGLGDANRLHLVRGMNPAALHPELFSALFDPKADADLYAYTVSRSEGFYETFGDLNSVIPAAVSSPKVVSLMMEFGTLGSGVFQKLRMLNRLIQENRATRFGCVSDEVAAQVKAEFLAAFYPPQKKWREEVLRAAHGTFDRSLSRLAKL